MNFERIKIASLIILFLGVCFAFVSVKQKKIKFFVPKAWPQTVYDFTKNPLTEEGFKLGSALFFDPILSKDNSISCSSCHLSFTAFTHADHKLSHGINGKIGTRNSQVLINLAWSKSFMWDGGVNNIETQAINPITNPFEMDNSLTEVVATLNQSSKYRKLFYAAFEDSTITSQKLLKALAQYTLQLVSYNSKYDSVMRKERGVVFTQNERNGYVIFKQHCASCHTEPLFTNNSFENNGLAVDEELKDWGRMKITQNSSDSLKFKVPTLRNVEFSAPYFHDGRVNKLKEVVNHYTSGIVPSKTLATALQTPIILSEQDKKDLVLFLKTLTDKYALYSERYRYNYSEIVNK